MPPTTPADGLMPDLVRNLWYPAAWEEEIAGEALLARTLLGKAWLLYRCADGRYSVLHDRCPHRWAPLSRGWREGDRIVCAYHGLGFAPDGRCAHHPAGDALPPGTGVARLVAEARHGLVWVWAGEPGLADPDKIPDFSYLTRQGASIRRRYSHFRAHYELATDNLMDLSHIDFLHRATFNTNGTMKDAPHTVCDGAGESILNTWRVPNVPRFPILAPHFGDGESIDQLTELHWTPPAAMSLRIGWLPAGATLAEARVEVINPHLLTPATATTTHYFWTCDNSDEAEAFARRVFEQEDEPMLEAVQRQMGEDDFWSLRPLVLRGDNGALRARRRLQRLRREEQMPDASSPASE